MIRVTRFDIPYKQACWVSEFIIPKGTPVIPADNLPEPHLYWAEPWEGMDECAESYHRNYGFLIVEGETEEVDVPS